MRFSGLSIKISYEDDISSLHATELEFRIAVFLKEMGYEYVSFDHEVHEFGRNLTACIPSRKAREGGQEAARPDVRPLTEEELETALGGPLMGSANGSQAGGDSGLD